MRKLAWILAVVLVVWCGWWWLASSGLQRGLDQWLAERRGEGWQAEAAEITGGGFPVTLLATLRGLALADPETGLALRTDALTISAPAWWPGDVTVKLDEGPIGLASPNGQAQLTMSDGVMAIELHPRRGLELESLGWTAGPWRVDDTLGLRAEAQDLTLTMAQREGAAYDFVARAQAFTPGEAARRGLSLPDGFPRAFDSLQLQASITFDRPWDRRAINERRPQPRVIDLHLAEARWGALSLNLAADLVVDANGVPEGTLSLQAENWQTMLDIAETTGALPSPLRGQAEALLGAMARASGNAQTLDVEIAFRGGRMMIGFIPLGPAPRLILR